MSMIEQQLKEIRCFAEEYAKDYRWNTADAFRKAADTIEALSAKLAAANMERSDRYYEVVKELVEQHNKTFELINKMPLEGNEVWHGYVGEVMQTLGYLIDNMDNLQKHYGGGWIACEDRLPKECGKYLIQRENGEIQIAKYKYNTTSEYMAFWIDYCKVENVIAWQPLPEPYRP